MKRETGLGSLDVLACLRVPRSVVVHDLGWSQVLEESGDSMHHRTSRGAFTLVAGGLTLASAAENVYGIDWEEPQRNDGNIVAMILIVMIHVCGFLGNSLLLLSIRNDPTLRSSLSGLMVCALSGTDMMYEAALIITLPFTMGQYPSYTVCQVQGFYIHALCAASIMILFIITVERYRLVVKNTATSRAAIKQGLVAAFIMAIMFAALPLFGFGHYELQPSKVFCFARGGYGVPSDDWYCIVASVIILNTTVGMILMYSMIWRLINRFQKSTGAALSNRTNQTRNKAEREIVKQFIVITSLFVLFWTPALIKFVSESAAQMVVEHAWFDVIVGMGAALNSASNPIAYGIMNKNIRLAVRAQLRRTFPRLGKLANSQVAPSTQEKGSRKRASLTLMSSTAMSLSDDAELSDRMQMLLRDVEAFEPNLNWLEEEEPSICVRRSRLSASDAFLEDAPSVLGAGQHSTNVEEEFKWKLWKNVEKRILETQEAPMRVVEFEKFVAAGAIPRSDQNMTRDVEAADIVVFVSHRWFDPMNGRPDDPAGPIKHGLIVRGVRTLMEQADPLTAARFTIW